MPRTDSALPAAAIHILLALGPSERHGYAIMAEVASMTNGSIRLAPGTLYTNIKRLLASGMIDEVEGPVDAGSNDQRRRYYRLSPAGRRVVLTELERMQTLIVGARPWLPGLDG